MSSLEYTSIGAGLLHLPFDEIQGKRQRRKGDPQTNCSSNYFNAPGSPLADKSNRYTPNCTHENFVQAYSESTAGDGPFQLIMLCVARQTCPLDRVWDLR